MMKVQTERIDCMEAIHGTHCNVRYSRPKRCKFCGKTIVWYSCDHLSVPGLPLDSRDPWIEHKCPEFNLHRWKQEVGTTPIGKYISAETSITKTRSIDAVVRQNKQLLQLRTKGPYQVSEVLQSIKEHIRLSEALLILPESLRQQELRLPEGIKKRRNTLLQQRLELLQWRDELLRNR